MIIEQRIIIIIGTLKSIIYSRIKIRSDISVNSALSRLQFNK